MNYHHLGQKKHTESKDLEAKTSLLRILLGVLLLSVRSTEIYGPAGENGLPKPFRFL